MLDALCSLTFPIQTKTVFQPREEKGERISTQRMAGADVHNRPFEKINGH
jgi:hypothetical protein